MSYQVLARKWRPSSFHEMLGQEHVLQALINGLDSDRLHHAYLFTGTRGVGKTSVARILAKCLNCEKGVSSRACGECGACLEIAEGRFVDLIEVDAASRTKVEDTRELLENVQYAPSKGRFKIYLIDEVHMLSTHSFNALLKTLEEPPPHVKFLLATTDPQRLPATILSRCLQFSLKNMTPELIVGHLQHILDVEQVEFEEPGIWHLARAGAGSMRDALSLTDQAIAYGGGHVTEAGVRSMLGTIDKNVVGEMIAALNEQNAERVLAIAAELANGGVDLEGFLSALSSGLHTLAVLQAVPEYDMSGQEHAEPFKVLASKMTGEDVQLFYQISVHGLRDMPFTPEPRVGLEMALLRMLAFLPEDQSEPVDDSADPLKKKSTSGEQQPGLDHGISSNVTSHLEEKNASMQSVVREEASQPLSANGSANMTGASAATNVVDARVGAAADSAGNVARSAGANVSEFAAPKAASDVVPVTAAKPDGQESSELLVFPSIKRDDKPVRQTLSSAASLATSVSELNSDNWYRLFEALPISGMARNVAANCELLSVSEAELSFRLDEHNCRIFKPAHTEQIRQAINAALDGQLKVLIEPGTVAKETPFARSVRLAAEQQQAAVDSIMSDPYVLAIVETFSAQVVPESIKPRMTDDKAATE